jgi:hypothetical protein
MTGVHKDLKVGGYVLFLGITAAFAKPSLMTAG